MKIGIDIQSTQCNVTGIGYYVRNLIRHLGDIPGTEFFYYKYPGDRDLNTPGRIYWENVGLTGLAKKDNIDILHIPGFAGPMIKGKYKKITTVHDLIGMIYPGNLSPVSRFYWQKWLPACVRNSDMIIAQSECTRKDIMRLLNVPAEKIRVILQASREDFRRIEDDEKLAAIRDRYGLPSEFVLSVGTIEPRKNITGLVEAFADYVKEADRDLKLVLVGKKDWGYGDVEKKIRESGLGSKAVFVGYVPDSDLPAIYNLAKFFVLPSFYEGFGLPVLEALSCGKPVISSNVSSLPEITGDAAILVDPHDIRQLREGIKRVDGDSSFRSELSNRALEHAKKFSWKETAVKTLEVYKEVIEKG
ncbi:MAG: glycosyltransferase family 1 protein [Candidatus Omnitrophota bacterium]